MSPEGGQLEGDGQCWMTGLQKERPRPQSGETGLPKVTYVPRENTDPRMSVLKAFHCTSDT